MQPRRRSIAAIVTFPATLCVVTGGDAPLGPSLDARRTTHIDEGLRADEGGNSIELPIVAKCSEMD